jgi:hypothetical protein
MARYWYDLTDDKWISPSSTDQVDAGASAEPGHCLNHDRVEHSKPLGADPLAPRPLRSPSAGGTLALRVFDALLTIAALAMFATVALFVMALA